MSTQYLFWIVNKFTMCVCMYAYIYIYIYIYTVMAKISAPLIKEGFENESALLIILIFYFKSSKKTNLSLDNTILKWGEISL